MIIINLDIVITFGLAIIKNNVVTSNFSVDKQEYCVTAIFYIEWSERPEQQPTQLYMYELFNERLALKKHASYLYKLVVKWSYL